MLELLPPYFVSIVSFVFGVIIGSFLNVYIYRFHTGKSLSGGSHCLSCQKPLRFYDLFPLLSYVFLLGRCRRCGSTIPSRYFWVELVTGLLFLLTVNFVADIYLWPLVFVLVSVLVVVSVYDLYHFVIPNVFVGVLLGIALIYLGYDFYLNQLLVPLLLDILGAVLAFCFFGGLWLYSKGAWLGFGDAKLVVPLALLVGIDGVFSMLTLSFWIGTVISLLIIVWQKYLSRGQVGLRFSANTLTIKSEVPFAPFIILGFLVVFLFQIDVLDWFSYVL